MNHKYSATDLFPSWYKSIDPAVSPNTVSLRVQGIQKVLTKEDINFWLDVVRIAFALPPNSAANADILVQEFKNADTTGFPLTSNENVLTVLSKILLCFLFELPVHNNKSLIAEAVSNVVFFGQFDSSDIPFYLYACEAIAEDTGNNGFDVSDSINTLSETLAKLEENEEEDAIVLDDGDHISLIKTIDNLFHQNIRLKEEINVLWWLFGGFSTLNNNYFDEVGVTNMALAAPKELVEMSNNGRRFLAAKHFIARVLVLANKGKAVSGKFSVVKVIAAASTEFKQRILLNLDTPSELTPCMYALLLSTQFDKESVWKAGFESKINGADIDKSISPVEVAYQFYNEILFLSRIER